MRDKYSLSDKFVVLSIFLSEEYDADSDIKKFKEIKRIRDSLFHGDEVSEDSLPNHDIQNSWINT